MSWITLTAENVKGRFTDEEMLTYEQAGDIDPETKISEILNQVISLVRGKVASCSKVASLGPDGTIPEELLWSAATIAKYSLVAVIPGMNEEFGSLRSEEYRRAMDQLDAASRCEIRISTPDSTTATKSPASFGGSPLLKF